MKGRRSARQSRQKKDDTERKLGNGLPGGRACGSTGGG